MTDPLGDLAQRFPAITAALNAPNMRDQLLPTRAAGSKIYTPEDAIKLATNMAAALDRTPRLPISATTTKHPDGSLTIRITPHTT